MIDINFRFFNKHFKFEYIYSKRILRKFLPKLSNKRYPRYACQISREIVGENYLDPLIAMYNK